MGILSNGRSGVVKELEYTTQSVPKGKRFCTICGEVKRLHYFEGESTHCSACCEKMLHTRVQLKSIPVVICVLLVAAFATYLSVFTVPYCVDLFKAQAAERDKRLSDACTYYATAVSGASDRNAALLAFGKKNADGTYTLPNKTFFEAGTRTWTRYLQTYASLYSEYEAASLALGSLNKDEVEKTPYIAGLQESQDAYNEAMMYAQQVESKYAQESATETTYNKIIADLTKYAEESDSRYIKGYIELFKARAAQFFKADDLDTTMEYFDNVLEYLPDEFMVVYTEEADAAMKAGKYEAAVGIYEKLLEKNKDYSDAYPSIAKAAFLAGDEEKLASVYARYDVNDPVRLRMEMQFALRADDMQKAAEVRQRANKTIAVEAENIFNTLLSEQSIGQDEKTTLLGYVDYALYDAAYSLLQGDTEDAFRLAYDVAFNETYYYAYITGDSSGFTKPLLNMAWLCALWVNNEEACDMIAEIGQNDDATQKVIDGELTVRDVFVEGKADIL